MILRFLARPAAWLTAPHAKRDMWQEGLRGTGFSLEQADAHGTSTRCPEGSRPIQKSLLALIIMCSLIHGA